MKAREDLPFGQELVFKDIDMSVLKREGLQRIVNAELRMLYLIDGTHSALSKQADDSVCSNLLSGY